jgi:hypothetical protein
LDCAAPGIAYRGDVIIKKYDSWYSERVTFTMCAGLCLNFADCQFVTYEDDDKWKTCTIYGGNILRKNQVNTTTSLSKSCGKTLTIFLVNNFKTLTLTPCYLQC